jgi:prephenate dehydrogenase
MSGKNMRIAIIGGAGRMGRWLAGFLKENGGDVVLSDIDAPRLREAGEALGLATFPEPPEAIAGADYVLLSVPVESFEAVAAAIGPHIRPGQTVIDVTSVKERPVELMHRFIRAGAVLGAHPLFGPGAASIANKNFVLTPVGDAETALALKVKKYLEGKNARVSLMTPAGHDEMMSLVLGLSHFIALAAADTLLDSGELQPMGTFGSSTYKVLLTLVESVLSEDPELYASIQMNLPGVVRFEELFLEKTGEWAALVAAGRGGEFAGRMKDLKDRLAEIAPDFEKSYEKMYRIVEGL